MLELPGQSALSDFRLKKLLMQLQERDERVNSVDARFTYFIALGKPLSAGHKKRLKALLLSGERSSSLGKGARKLFVVPRPGTISPWSSKATDIAHACDIEIERIERGICFGLQLRGAVSDEDVHALGKLLSRSHDRGLARYG